MAQLSKGKTFISGETVTPQKLHDLVDLGTVANIVDSDISASAAIAGTKLANGAITTAKIADASVTTEKLANPFTLRTAQATTSGTSFSFTDIPPWAKRITVMFAGVSSSSASASILVRIGTSSGIEATGYISGSQQSSNSTTGFIVRLQNADHAVRGHMFLTHLGGNTWVSSHAANLNTLVDTFGGGTKTLSGTLTQLVITTVNGTDTFDGGSVNISYEG